MSWVGVLTQATAPPPLDQVDLLPAATRAAQIEKMEKRLAATFAATKFAGCAMVPVAARPGGPDGAGGAEGLAALTAELTRRVPPPVAMGAPEETKPLLFAVDHCFAIKGQGTVLTGTVLQGRLAVNQSVEIPTLKLERKVKSMQMFRRAVAAAGPGDRLGVCVTDLNAKVGPVPLHVSFLNTSKRPPGRGAATLGASVTAPCRRGPEVPGGD